jgi:hypothetical protein
VTIDIDVSIPNQPAYTVNGEWDGYPAHDIYINNTLVQFFDPTVTGDGVGSLIPPMEYSFSPSGTLP